MSHKSAKWVWATTVPYSSYSNGHKIARGINRIFVDTEREQAFGKEMHIVFKTLY